MKTKLVCLFFFVLITQTALPQFNHRYIVSGTGKKEVQIIDENGRVEWAYPCLGKTNDVWQLSNGNVIFSDQDYAKEVNSDKETIWEYKAPKGGEIHSISPIGERYLMAVNGSPLKIMELNKQGKILKTIEYDTGIENAHAQARQIRKTPWETYLVGTMKNHSILEIDKNGKLLREIPVKGQAFVGIPLPNKNILIACGDGHSIVEIDEQNQVVWEVTENDIEGVPLRFAAGLQRLPNGNTVICNWGGHGHRGQQVQIVEITRAKKVVGKVFNYELLNEPSAIQILENKGKPEMGELYK